jgi:hypothetical protein
MKKNATFALLLVALTFAAGRAGANPTAFDYSFSASPGTVASGTGSVTFTIFPSAGSVPINFGTESVLLAAQVFPTSSASPPGDTYNSPFTLNLHIKDNENNQGDLAFSGHVVGRITSDTSALHVTFDSPLTKITPIGGIQYSGTVEPKDGPLPAPIGDASILLDVKLTPTLLIDGGGKGPSNPPGGPVTGGHGPSHAPEPSALLLGLSAAATVAFWRRRRKAA